MKKNKIILIAFTLVASGYWLMPYLAEAAPNINATNKWAWNDVIGWIDFYYTGNQNVEITDTDLRGYASSSVGFISLNCASGPPGSVCTNAYSVTNSLGTFAGWAWNETIGWISFNCSNTNTCSNVSYSVRVVNGELTGWAWNDVVGWISFNCSNTASCGTIDYKVGTTWTPPPTTGILTSSIFDATVGSATFLNLSWQGALNGGEVKFHVASSNSSLGPWNYIGPDNSAATFYGGGTAGPDTPFALTTIHSIKRYIRYRVYMTTSGAASPQIDAIIITYIQ